MEVDDTAKVRISSRGGQRIGSGNPKGSGRKLTAESLLREIRQQTGVDYAEQLARNYNNSILNNDSQLTMQYDKIILSKVLADRHQVEVTNTEDLMLQRQIAFDEAIEQLKLVQGTLPAPAK